MRIVVVDGDAVKAAQLQSLLAAGGFQNLSRTSSLRMLLEEPALRAAGRPAAPDLVILGVEGPDADPVKACRTLAGETDSGGMAVVVLFSDGGGHERLVAECLRAGALDAIDWSVTESELLRRLGLVLGLQWERRCRRTREEALETELAERKVVEARLKHLVDHDDLTGLPNRRRLDQALELAVIRSRNFHRTNALLYLDLDQFKLINDTEGHDAGDRLLTDVANRLRAHAKGTQMVARIGSDEFAILMEHVTEEASLAYAQSVREMLSTYQFVTSSHSYHVGASVGVALNTPEESLTASELLARADQACYLAKQNGRNTVYKFSGEDEVVHALRNDAQWVPVIRNALADNKFFMVFQPVMKLPERHISHYEALIRMNGGSGEVFTPADFIPVAERMGLIHQIDLWVVEYVLDFMASLPPECGDISMSVNLSGHAFRDASLLPLIKKKLDMTWISASRLVFEITETAAITNFAETRRMVARLRALGCRFALDDFGAGFASFSYIKNFPVDMLKIDGSFVADMINDTTDQLLVRSMVEVAHSLGKKVVAEYVENEGTMDMLAAFGVDYVQGHYVGLPAATAIERTWLGPDVASPPAAVTQDTPIEASALLRELTGDTLSDDQ